MQEKLVPSINVNNYDGGAVVVLQVIVPWSENNGKRIEKIKEDIKKTYFACTPEVHITYPGL